MKLTAIDGRGLGHLALFAFFVLTLFAVLAVTQSNFAPDPTATAAFMARAQSQVSHNFKVTAAALSPPESALFFGEPLADLGIQPVWLNVENGSDVPARLLPAATDPAYFSPLEVAYRFHEVFAATANAARDQFFNAQQIATLIPAHSAVSGFIFTNLDSGLKFTKLLLIDREGSEQFAFTLPVAGGRFLGNPLAFDKIYPAESIRSVDLAQLRQWLEGLGCCTVNEAGRRPGDPLNLVIVEAQAGGLYPAFIEQGWHLTNVLDARSALETVQSFLFGKTYLSSPISPLFLFGRREDTALQKGRSSINQRNHFRLWLAPVTFEDRRVWVGQVSRDIGVQFSGRSWYLTTHKIGPNVDFDRDYLLQDLMIGGSVARFGYVEGVGAASPEKPRRNLFGDPYFTDGLRLVLFLSDRKQPIESVEELAWEPMKSAP